MKQDKSNKKITFPLKGRNILHVSICDIYSRTYNPSVNVIYDDVKLKARNVVINRFKKVTLSPNAYSKRVGVFRINNSRIANKLLRKINKKYFIYINASKYILPYVHLCMYILFIIILILLISSLYNNIDITYINESDNLVDYAINSSNGTYKKFSLNTINKSIPSTIDLNNQVKLELAQSNQLDVNSKYENSIILNKVKELHLKEIVSECNAYKDRILKLEMEINSYKEANYNLSSDINNILREMESGNKNSL
jgi:hypothetical protein